MGKFSVGKILGVASVAFPALAPGAALYSIGESQNRETTGFNSIREMGERIARARAAAETYNASLSDAAATVDAGGYFSGSDFGNLGGIPVSMFRQPPNGFNGAAQQSVAVRYGIAKATGTRGATKSRGRGKSKAKKKVTARRAAPKRKASGKTAMQRKMARLRARRGK